MKKIIGIITIPINSKYKDYYNIGKSVMVSSNLNFFKDDDITILPIPFNTTEPETYFKKIHGLIIPGDTVFTCEKDEFNKICDTLIHLAIKLNDNGVYFPILGICKGMQHMLLAVEHYKNDILDKLDTHGKYKLPLNITNDGIESNLFKDAVLNRPKWIIEMSTKRYLIHNHKYGLSLFKYNNNRKIKRFYKCLSINRDRNGKEFINIIEAYKYPFYGLQFHPESIYAKKQNYFSEFFISEVKKNKNKDISQLLTSDIPSHTLIKDCPYTELNCFIYS